MDNNSSLVTKQIIDEVVNRYKNPVEREDIDFIDVFFPKVCAIYGEEACRMINENNDPTMIINKRGLNIGDIGVIDRILAIGKKAYDEDKSISNLFDIERSCNPYLKEYATKVLGNITDKKERDHMLEVIDDSFNNSDEIFTPMSELQHEIEEYKNNVK